MTDRAIQGVIPTELRKLAEERIQKNEALFPENTETLCPEETHRILHELRVHQIELEMQNEELRRAYVELDLSRERYFELFDLAPTGYFTVNEKGLIAEANLRAASLLGVPRGELIRKPLTQYIQHDDQNSYYFHRKKLIESRELQTWEMRMLHATGDQYSFWVRVKASIMENPDGSLLFRIIITDITELKHAQETLEHDLEEQKILLRETHHRIKNNVAAIESLLSLQASFSSNQEAISMLQEAISRLEIMRELYDRMLISGDDRDIPVDEYMEGLTRSVAELFAGKARITVDKNFESFTLSSKLLFPFGIIANELLTNALKYAFTGREAGLVRISITLENDLVTLIVKDDGVGLPEGFDPEASRGFGLMLVHMLTRQLYGSFKMVNDAGTRCTFEFRKEPAVQEKNHA
jgi:PAS domain S-box-containing protein